MNYTENLSQALATVAKIDAQAATAGTYLTDAIDTSKYRRTLFIVDVGTMGAGGTVDFKVQASATSGGSYADVDATNAAIAQVLQASAGSSTISLLEVKDEKLSLLGKPWIKGLLTIGTATSPVSVVALSTLSRNKPSSLGNLAAVKQIVVY